MDISLLRRGSSPRNRLDLWSLPRDLPPEKRVQPQDQIKPLELTWISPSWEEGPAPGSELDLWSSPGYLTSEKRVQPRNRTRPLELTWISPSWEEPAPGIDKSTGAYLDIFLLRRESSPRTRLNSWSSPGYLPPEKRVQHHDQTKQLELTWISSSWEEGPAPGTEWTPGAHLDISLLRRGSSPRNRMDHWSSPGYLPPEKRVQPQEENWTTGAYLYISLLRRGSSPRKRTGPLEHTWISPFWEEGPAPGTD